VVTAIAAPAMQALVADLIDDESDLANAVALNASMSTIGRLLGPALGAAVLWSAGAAACFLVNALSFTAMLVALAAIRVRTRPTVATADGLSHGLGEGLRYVRRAAPLRNILLLVAVMSMAGMSFYVLLPLVAAEILRGEEGTYGLLTVTVGLGATFGALFLVRLGHISQLGRWTAVAPAIFATSIAVVPFAAALSLMLLLAATAGFALMVTLGASNILLQKLVDDDKRGRVMSLFLTAFMGLPPIGSLLAGAIAGRFGLDAALWIGAGCCLAGAGLFSLQLNRLHAAVQNLTAPTSSSEART
jgi:predicted MFS family arabinose efflux permease